jgi:hypothetical protein
VKKGILPDLQDSYKIRRNQNKTTTSVDDETETKNAEQESYSQDIAQKLKRYFSGAQSQQQAPRSNEITLTIPDLHPIPLSPACFSIWQNFNRI